MNDAITHQEGGDLADLILYLARLGQSCPSAPDAMPLTSAQWAALRYFARANRFSRTPSAFSDFHATTRGTASQTVKSLVALKLLERRSHDHDGRSTVIEVTEAGRAQLRADPMRDLRAVLDALPVAQQRALAAALGQTIQDLAARRMAPVFGTCSDCNHCEIRPLDCFCRSTQTALCPSDMQAICVGFQPVLTPR